MHTNEIMVKCNKFPDGKRPVKIHTRLPLKKRKFLVDSDITVADLLMAIRKFAQIRPEESIFLFHKNRLLRLNELFSDFKPGVLDLWMEKENVFGCRKAAN